MEKQYIPEYFTCVDCGRTYDNNINSGYTHIKNKTHHCCACINKCNGCSLNVGCGKTKE